MNPGRELDALVAEKVMGITTFKHGPLDANGMCRRCWRPAGEGDFLPPECHPEFYSTDIAAAWQVVEKMREHALQFELRVSVGTLWIVWVSKLSLVPFQEDKTLAEAKGETAPHAICLAALKAVGAL